jgi:hypothetical protein
LGSSLLIKSSFQLRSIQQFKKKLLSDTRFIMISGDVHGPVSNMGNYNSGVIAGTVNIGTLVQSNKSE